MKRIIDQVLEYHLKVPMANIAGPAKISEDLGADELDLMEICMDIEDKFGIQITDAELVEVQTVQDLYDLVNRKQDEKQAHLTPKPNILETPLEDNPPHENPS